VSTQGQRVLDPIERISEFLFGLIMVLTLTSSLNVSGVNRGSVRDMLLEALGCNVAWGIIDAFFYLLNSVGQRGQGAALLGEFTEDCRPTRGLWHGCEALPPLVATLMPPQELESLWEKLAQLQRGFLVGITHKKLEITAYIFNLGWTTPTAVLEASVSF
jgi:hypothetical protein